MSPLRETVAGAAFAPFRRIHWDDARLVRWLIMLFLSPLLLWLADSLFSGTEVITPLDPIVLWAARGLGAADGMLLFVVLRMSPTHGGRSVGREILLFVTLSIFGAATFDALSWRVANWVAFGGLSAAFERAIYPVKSLSHGRKGSRSTIAIDPYHAGEDAEIPISSSQYAVLLGQTERLCVTVQQRRSSTGVVQIKTDGSFTATEPAVVPVQPC